MESRKQEKWYKKAQRTKTGLVFLVFRILPFVLAVCVFREVLEDGLRCGAGPSSGLNTRWGLRKKS